MGKKSRRKGRRVEYLVRDLFRSLGYECHRIPMSGRGSLKGDLLLRVKSGKTLTVEVKARKEGFSTLYSWLEGGDMLILKKDRQEPLVVIPFSLLRYLLHVGGSGENS